jgi:hypothetical protein
MPQWFPLPRSDVAARAAPRPRRRRPLSVLLAVECLEQRTLLSATGPGHALSGGVLGFDRGGPHYPQLPPTGPALQGGAPAQPAPTLFAVPVNAPDGSVPAAGVPLAPTVLPVAPPTAGAGLVALPILSATAGAVGHEAVSTTVAPRYVGPVHTTATILETGRVEQVSHAGPDRAAVDIVFRHHLVALAGRVERHVQPEARPDAFLARTESAEALPSQADRAALAPNLTAEVATAQATAALPAAEETGLPVPQPTLATTPSGDQPEVRGWVESLALSATAVLESPAGQEVTLDAAGVLAGCLLAYGLQRGISPAKETARRSVAVPRQRP